MIAHIAGVPVEELLPALVSGISAGILLKLTSTWSGVRRSRNMRAQRPTPGPPNADQIDGSRSPAGMVFAQQTNCLGREPDVPFGAPYPKQELVVLARPSVCPSWFAAVGHVFSPGPFDWAGKLSAREQLTRGAARSNLGKWELRAPSHANR